MKIILIPSNTDLNRGDQALVWESIRLIEEVCDDPEISLMRGDDKRQYAQTERLGFPFIPKILKHPGRIFSKQKHIRYSLFEMLIMGIVAIYDFILSFMLLVRCRCVNKLALLLMSDDSHKAYSAFKNCDAVFVKGGGFIHSYGAITDAYQIYYLLYYFLVAIRFKKQIFVLPNSIGPLKSRLARLLACYVLRKCTYVSVRESVSEKFLLSQNLNVSIHRHADLGFFLTSDENFDANAYLVEHGVDTSLPIVGITLRPYRFPGEINPEKKYTNYITSIVAFCHYLEERKIQIVLFSHTLGPGAHENDTIAINEVSNMLDKQHVKHIRIEDEELDCRQVMTLYSKFNYLVGTRFHSVIFAQNSYVPTIAISYGGNKGIGIMEDVGLSEFSIPMSEMSKERIIDLFKNLTNERIRVENQLKKCRTDINEDRLKMINEVKEILDNKAFI